MRMGITSQDWRVTANLEIDRCLAALSAARTGDLTMSEVVRTCWEAYTAAAAAAGAIVEAELQDGAELSAVEDLLGGSDIGVERGLLKTARNLSRRRLQARLPDA
jgi:hypothetical protein